MEDRAIIEADFATWRPVQGRKVLQLVFEVPVEKTQEVLTKLGTPIPGQSIWCAIAVLDLQATRSGAAPPNPPEKLQRKWEDMKLREQAVLRCKEPDFWKYMKRDDEEGASDEVRLYCEVETRTQLDTNREAGGRWLVLDRGYQAFRTEQKYGEARR